MPSHTLSRLLRPSPTNGLATSLSTASSGVPALQLTNLVARQEAHLTTRSADTVGVWKSFLQINKFPLHLSVQNRTRLKQSKKHKSTVPNFSTLAHKIRCSSDLNPPHNPLHHLCCNPKSALFTPEPEICKPKDWTCKCSSDGKVIGTQGFVLETRKQQPTERASR